MVKKTSLKVVCNHCGEEKVKTSYYTSTENSVFSKLGVFPVCKDCIMNQIDYNDMSTVYRILQTFDVAFDYEVWEVAVKSKSKTFGKYMSMLKTFPQLTGRKYADSVFEKPVKNQVSEEKFELIENKVENSSKKEFVLTDKIIDKWGEGYTEEEYRFFEKKFNILLPNYSIKTAIHQEALQIYVRLRVKEEIATAKGDVNEAKKWGDLASSQAEKAKLNVNQLSKSDISGGVDVLAQLFEAVESEVGMIPLLPSVMIQPHDEADLIIWSIINYYRRLEDKSKISYSDIWSFYDSMLEDFFDAKGFSEQQKNDFMNKRESIFRDLEKVYKEPVYDEGDS